MPGMSTISTHILDQSLRLLYLSRKLAHVTQTVSLRCFRKLTACVTTMTIDPTISEWLNLIFRWIHVFAGIMWVGTTYYFTWLDARLSEEEKAVSNTGTSNHIYWDHIW